MPKRQSDIAKIVEFFNTAPIDKVEIVFDLCKDAYRRRAAALSPVTTGPTRRRGRPRRTTVAAPSDDVLVGASV